MYVLSEQKGLQDCVLLAVVWLKPEQIIEACGAVDEIFYFNIQ